MSAGANTGIAAVVAVPDSSEISVTDNSIVDRVPTVHPLLAIGTALAVRKGCYLHGIRWLGLVKGKIAVFENGAQTMPIS